MRIEMPLKRRQLSDLISFQGCPVTDHPAPPSGREEASCGGQHKLSLHGGDPEDFAQKNSLTPLPASSRHRGGI